MRASRSKPGEPLTEREHSVLIRYGDLNNAEIAEDLHLTVRQVEYSEDAIFRKLRVKTRIQACVEGIRQGLMELPPLGKNG